MAIKTYFKAEDLSHNAIVVVGYNRIASIKRLLSSITIACYDDEVPLVISIDRSGNEELYAYVDDFSWEHGNKYVIIQEERRGLKEHIYRCGDLSQYFKSITILEDDLFVSPYFYQYVKQTVEKYGDNPNVAGISLYRNEFNGFNSLPLFFLNIGHDVFAYQSTSTWGETFTYDMWKPFRKWLEQWNGDFSNVDMYQTIKNWDKAWSKYFEAYLILENKYFIYPYLSVSTNNNDAGTHVTSVDINNTYQAELLYGERKFILPEFEDLVKYDTYAQCELLKEHIGLDSIAIDLNGNRENVAQFRYLLTIKPQNYKIVKSYGLRLRPMELNVLLDIPGQEIYLYDTSFSATNKHSHSVKRMLADYYLREYSSKLVYNKAFHFIIKYMKSWLQKCWRKLNKFM